MEKMKQKTRNRCIRAGIQVIFFIAAPGLFSAAFAGIRYLVTQIHNLELIEFTVFLKLLVVLLAFTMLAGRFFCGYACAFGTLGDAVYGAASFLSKKIRKKKMPALPDKVIGGLQYVKYGVLAAICILCFLGWYNEIAKADPWELFAAFTAGNFSLAGFKWAAIVLAAIVVGMCFVPRFFCQFLCPMGAVFALIPALPWTVLSKDKNNCLKGCSACSRSCPASLSVDGFSGECIQCGSCIDACPKGNVRTETRKIRGNEIVAVLVKAGVLFLICYPWM